MKAKEKHKIPKKKKVAINKRSHIMTPTGLKPTDDSVDGKSSNRSKNSKHSNKSASEDKVQKKSDSINIKINKGKTGSPRGTLSPQIRKRDGSPLAGKPKS